MKQITDKTFKTIIVGYAENNTRDTYKLYNTGTNRVITTREVNWDYWKITDPSETLEYVP